MSTLSRGSWLSALLVTTVPLIARAQEAEEWHPDLKEIWENSDDWRLIAPADLDLDPQRLVGLRAVYERGESLLSDPLMEEAIFQFDRGWLRGEPVVIARFSTSGDPDKPDSGPSSWTRILEPSSMQSLGSVSMSTRWGTFVNRVEGSEAKQWALRPDAEDFGPPTVTSGGGPMIDMAVWAHVLSGLPLREGMEFRLQANRSWVGPAFRVAGRTRFADTRGTSYEVWAVETNMGTSGWLGITYVIAQAPYFVGFEMRHVANGDVNIRWRLKSYRVTTTAGPP